MNTRQIHYVITVAEEKSFSAAAKKLYVSQPSLSEYIKRVENELGYELFDRMVSPMKLTLAGEVYIETVREIQSLMQQMEKRLHDIDDTQYGKLTVGVSPYSGVMPSVMKQFFEIFPNYDVKIQDSLSTAERLKMLEQGELDLCIQPVYDSSNDKFTVEPISTDYPVLVVPAHYPVNDELTYVYSEKSRYPELNLEDIHKLADIPLITVDEGKKLRARVDTLFKMAGVKPHIKLTCYKSEGCLDMAIAGAGIAIVQSSLMNYRDVPSKVKCYFLHSDVVSFTMGAVYVRDRYIPKAARTLIDILKTI